MEYFAPRGVLSASSGPLLLVATSAGSKGSPRGSDFHRRRPGRTAEASGNLSPDLCPVRPRFLITLVRTDEHAACRRFLKRTVPDRGGWHHATANADDGSDGLPCGRLRLGLGGISGQSSRLRLSRRWLRR